MNKLATFALTAAISLFLMSCGEHAWDDIFGLSSSSGGEANDGSEEELNDDYNDDQEENPEEEYDDDGEYIQSSSSSAARSSSSSIARSSSSAGQSSSSGSSGGSIEKVPIGTQVWMKRNLNIAAGNSKCYDNDPANCEIYGRLYDWATAKTVCPGGWHLPSDEEWSILINFAEGIVGSARQDNPAAGKYLKAASGWDGDGNGEDTFGFSALPGGVGYSDGSFDNIGSYGNWWSADPLNDSQAYMRLMLYIYDRAYWSYDDKSYFFSVRCIQD